MMRFTTFLLRLLQQGGMSLADRKLLVKYCETWCFVDNHKAWVCGTQPFSEFCWEGWEGMTLPSHAVQDRVFAIAAAADEILSSDRMKTRIQKYVERLFQAAGTQDLIDIEENILSGHISFGRNGETVWHIDAVKLADDYAKDLLSQADKLDEFSN